MTHILHRAANDVMPVAVSGSGVEIVDAEGNRYLDASGGVAVSCLGHGHPDVLAAMRKQLDALAYAHTAFFSTDVAERPSKRPFGPALKLLARVKREALARDGLPDGRHDRRR